MILIFCIALHLQPSAFAQHTDIGGKHGGDLFVSHFSDAWNIAGKKLEELQKKQNTLSASERLILKVALRIFDSASITGDDYCGLYRDCKTQSILEMTDHLTDYLVGKAYLELKSNDSAACESLKLMLRNITPP